jgi:hypothetical protein
VTTDLEYGFVEVNHKLCGEKRDRTVNL